jgi:CPA1 family monovalent cation:H+ antiporter
VHETELLLLVLLVALPGLSVISRQIDVPYPILLVLGGLLLGALPGLPEPELDPDLVLVIFLPPLLYVAAFFADLRSLRANARPISIMSIGLVLITAAVIAAVAHHLLDLPWAAAFVLGGVLAPTDPIAATSIMRRLGVPRRSVNVIEGESLVNDGTALVIVAAAVAAAIGGTFSLADASLEFVIGIAGGVAVGLVVAWLIAQARKRIDDTPTEITISLFTGYAAYLPAEQLHVSGVLAAVTAGIYLGLRAPDISTAQMRLQGFATWDLVQFLLNGVLFVLIGLQLPHVIEGLDDGYSNAELIGYGALFSAVVICVRIAFLQTAPYVIRALDRRPSQRARRVGWRERLVSGWSGMRGGVSLAAALAIPLETDAGTAFPGRDLIIFITFCVILATVVGQGLTLPYLIRALGVESDDGEEQEELRARLVAAKAALEEIDRLEDEGWVREDTLERMRGLYRYRKRRFAARAGKVEDNGYEDRSQSYQRAVRSVLEAQRGAIVELRNNGEISNDVMHRVGREIDLEDTRLEI